MCDGVFSSTEIRKLWSKSALKIWPESYRFISFKPELREQVLNALAGINTNSYTSIILDHHEIALIVAEDIWQAIINKPQPSKLFGPLKCITLDVPLDVEISGYLRPAVDRLADAGISIIPQCALVYDHLLVRENDLEAACQTLELLRQDSHA